MSRAPSGHFGEWGRARARRDQPSVLLTLITLSLASLKSPTTTVAAAAAAEGEDGTAVQVHRCDWKTQQWSLKAAEEQEVNPADDSRTASRFQVLICQFAIAFLWLLFGDEIPSGGATCRLTTLPPLFKVRSEAKRRSTNKRVFFPQELQFCTSVAALFFRSFWSQS